MASKKTPKSDHSDLYDFSGPLWEKYFQKTRKNARFPRGYREVNTFQYYKRNSEVD